MLLLKLELIHLSYKNTFKNLCYMIIENLMLEFGYYLLTNLKYIFINRDI